jgi:IS1 family transposase
MTACKVHAVKVIYNTNTLKHNVHIEDVNMNKLPISKRAQILGLLVEGTSLRATSRLAGVSINTVSKLLVDIGTACAKYQDSALRNLSCKRVQVDEIWAFCYAKAKNVKTAKAAPENAGDIWTWTAICAETKLVMSWLVGGRDAGYAQEFIEDLKTRLASRIRLTSDGHRAYLEAVESTFGGNADYVQLVKIYGAASVEGQKRYSPAECIGARKEAMIGSPDMTQVSTSFVERQNLTMRMSMRRFTRLTNAFSKKAENHGHAIALHFMFYNFGRIHKTLRITPAMAAGVSDHVWSLEEIAALA